MTRFSVDIVRDGGPAVATAWEVTALDAGDAVDVLWEFLNESRAVFAEACGCRIELTPDRRLGYLGGQMVDRCPEHVTAVGIGWWPRALPALGVDEVLRELVLDAIPEDHSWTAFVSGDAGLVMVDAQGGQFAVGLVRLTPNLPATDHRGRHLPGPSGRPEG